MTTITVSSKYQIVIPKEVRERLGIKPGTRLCVEGSDRGVLLVKEPTLEEARALLKGMAWEESEVRDETERNEEDAHFQDVPGVRYFPKP